MTKLQKAIQDGKVAPKPAAEEFVLVDATMVGTWADNVHFRRTMKSRAGKPKNRSAHKIAAGNRLLGKVNPRTTTQTRGTRGTRKGPRLVKKVSR
jgi:hypothetical protein